MKPSISLTGRPSKWQGLRWVSCMEDAGVLASVLGGGGGARAKCGHPPSNNLFRAEGRGTISLLALRESCEPRMPL